MNRWFLASLALSLTGCVSTTPKPVMPESAYRDHALLRVAFVRCAADGHMPQELAATGSAYAESSVALYSYDIAKFQREVSHVWAEPNRPSAEVCTSLAIQTANRLSAVKRANSAAAYDLEAWANFANGFAKFTPLLNNAVQPVAQPQVQLQQSRDEYQTVAINTPSGIIYKRCKMLNGKAVYCI